MRYRVKGQRHFDTTQLPANERRGLVGHWVGGGSGYTWFDRSGRRNHGTLTSGPTWNLGVEGIRNAVSFDGTNDYVLINDSDSLDLASMTICAWVYLTSYPADTKEAAIVSKGGTGETAGNNHNYLLTIENNLFNTGLAVVATFLYENSSGTNYTTYFDLTADNFPLNTWHHVLGVFDDTADTMDVYIDGVQGVAGTGKTGTPENNAQNVRIGYGNVGANSVYFPGKIDDVRIYNRALSKAEIVKIAKGTYNLVLPHSKRSYKNPAATATGVASMTGVGSLTL